MTPHSAATAAILRAGPAEAEGLRKIATAAGHPNFPPPRELTVWPGAHERRLEYAAHWARNV